MWIARDKNGSLWIYKHKPIKNKFGAWIVAVDDSSRYSSPIRIWEDIFPEVKWQDKKPTEIILK